MISIKRMPEPLRTLLLMGVKQSGSYDPIAALSSVEEEMTGREIEAAESFLKWIVRNKFTFGHGNIDEKFAEFEKENLSRAMSKDRSRFGGTSELPGLERYDRFPDRKRK